MAQPQLFKDLIDILGTEHGGPSLSYQNGEYVIYRWYDAPVGTEILGRDRDLHKAIRIAAHVLNVPKPIKKPKVNKGPWKWMEMATMVPFADAVRFRKISYYAAMKALHKKLPRRSEQAIRARLRKMVKSLNAQVIKD